MEFILLKLLGLGLYTALVVYVTRNFSSLNSVSDLETVYKAAAAKVDAIKAQIAEEIAAAEAKAQNLKTLV